MFELIQAMAKASSKLSFYQDVQGEFRNALLYVVHWTGMSDQFLETLDRIGLEKTITLLNFLGNGKEEWIPFNVLSELDFETAEELLNQIEESPEDGWDYLKSI